MHNLGLNLTALDGWLPDPTFPSSLTAGSNVGGRGGAAFDMLKSP
jgi:hypothetical protein